MIASFDLTKLSSLLKDFYKLTHIRITVFDDHFHELAAYPRNLPDFCRIIRTDPSGKHNCQLCAEQARETAARTKRPYTYRCHTGLIESISPVIIGNITIVYILFGQVFPYPDFEEGWQSIYTFCKTYQVDYEELKASCQKLCFIPEDYISSATHIMQAVASFLCSNRIVSLKQMELPVQIDQYITAHFTEPINAASLCQEFDIGKTQLYEIAKQSYGIGIAEHIRNLRIEKAKKLLEEESRLSITEIASLCGFNDYNYFITVFKRVTGNSPKQYAKSLAKHS